MNGLAVSIGLGIELLMGVGLGVEMESLVIGVVELLGAGL